jgi:hypothetical protein
MKYLMMAIVMLMLASIVGILVVKPFDRGNGKDAETPATIQEPDPSK